MNKAKFFKFFKGFISGIVLSFLLWFLVGLFAFTIAFNVKKGITYADEVDLDFAVSTCDTSSTSFYSSNFPMLLSYISNDNISSPVLINHSDTYTPVSVNFNQSSFVMGIYYIPYTSTVTNTFSYFNDSNWHHTVFSAPNNNRNVIISFKRDLQFDNNVSSFAVFTVDNALANSSFHASEVQFYDDNGYVFCIQFCFIPYYFDNSFNGFLSMRTYIVNSGDNSAYQQGFNDGYSDAKSSYYQIGYDKGYDVGYDIGERAGIDIGASDNNPYNFTNFFGAIIDVPIKVLTSLFNFNILGVNLLDFFVAIVTIAVVVFVIKLVVGGK